MFSVSRRFREPLALLVFDIDNFQALRAEHGEETAQRALALFASGLQTQMRLGDVIGRLSNDKFGVLLARCEPTGPAAMDARLRVDLAQRAPLELGFAISHSAGWARLRNGDRHLNDLLRRADAIFIDELRAAGWYEKTSQAFAVFLPVKSVGVMGDGRTYEYVVALRAVETQDFMTAHWAELPHSLGQHVSQRVAQFVEIIHFGLVFGDLGSATLGRSN
jgi:diguanylate cyclase (GGDEF)-like protein